MSYGKVGRQKLSSGTIAQQRMDEYGSLMVQSYGGHLAEACAAGRLFVGANQAKVAVTAAFATTYTGLVLENPIGSGKNVILHEVSYSASEAIATAVALGLMTGADAGDAAVAITPRNRLKSASAASSVCNLDNACTLTGTPVLEQLITTAWTEAVTAGSLAQPNVFPVNGSLILTPGYYVAIYASAAVAAACLFSFMWEEVDS